MFKTLPVTVLALTLQGCIFGGITKLNAEGAKVELVPETDKPGECKFLGKITGTSHDDDIKQAKKGAENDFRNKAAALKGNYAVVENVRGERDIFVNGKAYDCKTLDMQMAEEEKQQKAIDAQEASEAREQAEKDEEAKTKKEQEAKEAADKAETEKQGKKGKKGKKSASGD